VSKPAQPENEIQSLLRRLREAIDELSRDMQQVQWRLGNLERQFGVPIPE
jgi:transposase